MKELWPLLHLAWGIVDFCAASVAGSLLSTGRLGFPRRCKLAAWLRVPIVGCELWVFSFMRRIAEKMKL